MFLSDLSINRSYFVAIINILLIFFGFLIFQKTNIYNEPDAETPFIWIYVDYPGASPTTEEELILKPLEEVLKNIIGIKNMKGTAQTGSVLLSVELNSEISADKALENVHRAISSIKMPEGAQNLQLGKSQINNDPILTLAVKASQLSIQELSFLVKNNIQPQFQRVNGVSSVYLAGDRTREIQIGLKQEIIKSMNLSPLVIQKSVSEQIMDIPVGQLRQKNDISNIIFYKIPSSIDDISKLFIHSGNNQVIKLGNIAEIKDSLTNATSYVEYNKSPIISLNIYKDSQGNIVKIADAIRLKVDRLNREYKGKIKIDVIFDYSQIIQQSMRGLKIELVIGTLLAILSVFIFLHRWKNTLMNGFSIPASIVFSFAVIHYFHFSLNFKTLTLLVVISMFVAFIALPIFNNEILGDNKSRNKYFNFFDIFLEKLKNSYINIIKRLFVYKKTTILFTIILFVLSLCLLKFVPIVFTLQGDQGRVRISFFLAQNTPLEVSKLRAQEIENYIQKLPGVKNILFEIGSGQGGELNKIDFTAFLVDKSLRKFSTKEFQIFLDDGLKQFIFNSKEHIGYPENNYPIQFSLSSLKPELLKTYANNLLVYMSKFQNIRGATSSAAEPLHQFKIIPVETNSALMNVNPLEVKNILQLFFEGVKVGKYNDNGQYFDIRMLISNQESQSLSDLNSILIPSQNGNMVPLSGIAKLEKQTIDGVIHHLNGERVFTVKANYLGNDLAETTHIIQKYIEKTIPIEILNQLGGESSELQDMLSSAGYVFIFTVFFIFIFLSVYLKNVLGPLTIIFSISFVFPGAFIALLITRNALSIFSVMGIFMVMGFVIKNTILFVGFAQQRIKEGILVEHALIESANIHLKPILMTSITMIVAMLPMAFATGVGSEGRQNISVVMIGAALISIILTLFLVPCAYLFLYKSSFYLKKYFIR